MPFSHRTRSGLFHRGLSLVELLVVIAVIGVLAGLLFPVVSSVRNRWDLTKCAGQLSVFSHAITAFQNDFNGNMPSGSEQGFISKYVNIDYNRYAVRSSQYGPSEVSRGTFDPYFKCPALIKLDVQNARGTYTYAVIERYNYIYSDNSLRAVRGQEIQALMFCGTASCIGLGYSNVGGTPWLSAPGSSVYSAAGDQVQYPHFANGSDHSTITYGGITWTVEQFWSGKVNVLLMDGSVGARTSLRVTTSISDFNENLVIPTKLTGGAFTGKASTKDLGFWQGR